MGKDCTIIIRTFQPKKEDFTFDIEKLKNKDIIPLEQISKSNSVKKIIVVLNGDFNSNFSEIADIKGELPSYKYLKELTNFKINGVELEPAICTTWGSNAGSATALNFGLNKVETDLVMTFSPEMKIDDIQLDSAINTMVNEELNVLGFLRKDWEKFIARCVPQNTAAIWKTEDLLNIGGFSSFCNGSNGHTITLDDGTKTDLAGMEDFHALIRLIKKIKDFSWGMIGENQPIVWANENDKRNEIKIKRQEIIMNQYLKIIQPNDTIQLYSELYKNIKRYNF